MTIHVKAGKVRLHLWFPTSILKSRFGYKTIKRAIEDGAKKRSEKSEEQFPEAGQAVVSTAQMQSEQPQQDVPNFTREQMLELYNALKQCVKANGHFNLVEVHSADGEKVTIRV